MMQNRDVSAMFSYSVHTYAPHSLPLEHELMPPTHRKIRNRYQSLTLHTRFQVFACKQPLKLLCFRKLEIADRADMINRLTPTSRFSAPGQLGSEIKQKQSENDS